MGLILLKIQLVRSIIPFRCKSPRSKPGVTFPAADITRHFPQIPNLSLENWKFHKNPKLLNFFSLRTPNFLLGKKFTSFIYFPLVFCLLTQVTKPFFSLRSFVSLRLSLNFAKPYRNVRTGTIEPELFQLNWVPKSLTNLTIFSLLKNVSFSRSDKFSWLNYVGLFISQGISLKLCSSENCCCCFFFFLILIL